MTNQKREERALEGLIVSAFRTADQDQIESIRKPNAKERAALALLGPDFMDRLLSGKRQDFDPPPSPIDFGSNMPASEQAGLVLNRADDIDEATAKELEAKERELEERKRKERGENEETP
jgi:hypothetical protein